MSNEKDFRIAEKGHIIEYTGKGGDVVVPKGVNSVFRAFEFCRTITSLTLPRGIKVIDHDAFIRCESLTSITLPPDLRYLGKNAFYGCTGLLSVTLPDSLKTLEEGAFVGCTSLASVTLPQGLKSIPRSTFYGCEGLESIVIPEGVTEIENGAFSGCKRLSSVTLPSTLRCIGYEAFNGCESLAKIQLPEGLQSIGYYAFKGCTSLASVSLPQGLRSIGDHAFEGCTSLTSIALPGVLTSIGERTFYGCKKLASVALPSGITKIEKEAFQSCPALKELCFAGDKAAWDAIPKSESGIPERAVRVDMKPEGVNVNGCLCADGYLLRYVGTHQNVTLPTIVSRIADGALRGQTGIAYLTVASALFSIGSEAFAESPLVSFTASASIREIKEGAFRDCKQLVSVTLPTTLKTVAPDIFAGCDALRDVYFNDYREAFDALGITLPAQATLHYKERTYTLTSAESRSGKTQKVGESLFLPAVEALAPYLLRMEGESSSSYDNSDDERASSSESRSSFVRYREIEPMENTEALLWSGSAIVGVVFRIKDGRDIRPHRFFFNGSVAESFSVGYSASHSSRYTSLNRITLAKRGENGAPEEGRYSRYDISQNDPDF